MKIKHWPVGKVAAVLIYFLSSIAVAGDFNVNCSYSNNNLERCAAIISDLVTDKFVARFPSGKYSIFVHSDIHHYSNGGYVAYAVAGVVPKGSGQFPLRRYMSTIFNRNDRADVVRLAQVELENYRAVISNLMGECEISEGCDVYTPRKAGN